MTISDGASSGATAALSLALACGVEACSLPAAAPAEPVRAAQTHRAATPTFTNPLYKGQDPAYTFKDGFYYLCQSGPGNRIDIFKSPTLTDRGERQTVWTASRGAWNSRQIWAPEIHFVRGKWYIYYAASTGQNENHRMGVLEAATDDPQGPYIDRGMLYTGDDIENRANNRWAIDGTIFEHRGQLFFAWSGWEDHRDIQYLYLATMSDPATISSNRIKLAHNADHLWERVGENPRERGLHEGPAILIRNGRVMIAYSCSGSWQPTYKLGLLYADQNADLMDPKSWHKLASPVFQSTETVFGVGHNCFVKSPDGTEDWILYHAKTSRREGWDRVVHMQKYHWREDGLPDFGYPADPQRPLTAPSGDSGNTAPFLVVPRPATPASTAPAPAGPASLSPAGHP